MSLSLKSLVLCGVAAFGVVAAPAVAHAGIDSCGNIDVQANATCKAEVKGGCTAQCTPVRFEAACAGQLYTKCDGQCSAAVDVSCTASCNTDCLTKCKVNPPTFSCQGECEGRCDADCSGKCESAANKTECQASCKGTCSGKCEGTCTGTEPSAACEAKCTASCTGSCQARANIDCHVQCQSSGYVECKAKLEGGCKAQCEKPEGALFCEGQYVDTGNNFEKCVAALKAELNIKYEASGSASCVGNTCEAEGQAAASCAVAEPGAPLDARLLFVGAGALVFSLARRRARRNSL